MDDVSSFQQARVFPQHFTHNRRDLRVRDIIRGVVPMRASSPLTTFLKSPLQTVMSLTFYNSQFVTAIIISKSLKDVFLDTKLHMVQKTTLGMISM